MTNFELPPRETPLARMDNGKTSDTTIQATGPQEKAKCPMKIQTKTIAAQPADMWLAQLFWKEPIMPATMKWQIPIPTAPAIRMLFLPNLSTYRTAGIVMRNSITPTTPVASRLVVLPSKPKPSKMNGALYS